MRVRDPNNGGMGGDVQFDLTTLEFNNRQQLEYFHSRFLRLQQEVNLSGEIVSPTIIFFQYMKAFTDGNKLKVFIAPKMIDLTKFLGNNGKLAI